jgi:glycosyltransferase involved in cell wall biosynthesis
MTRQESELPLCAVTGGLLLGGSSTFLVNLTHAFQARGLRLPIIVLSEQNDHERDFAALQNPVLSIPRRRHIYEDRLALALRHFAHARPRAVLACLGSDSFEVLRLMPAGVVRMAVIQSHDPGPYEAARVYSKWIDVLIGVSSKICEHARSFPEFAGRRVEYIPYGIWFGESVKRSPAPSEAPLRLVYIGRMVEEQKRVSRLVELIQLLEARQMRFQFTFVGSGSELPRMQSALAHIKNIDFRGEVPNHAVSDILQTQDISVLLSDYEGLPLGLLESMGAGVVPVVSDLESGIRDVVTGSTGIRVPVGNVAAAADAIETLGKDRVKLAGLSTAAARLAREEYSAQKMAARYLHLIDQLPTAPVNWNPDADIPAPIGLKRWLYQGPARLARRWIKRAVASVRR